MDLIFSNEQVRQAFKSLKSVKLSEDGDATVLDIIRLYAVITATADIIMRNVFGKDRDGTGKSVVASSDSFQGGDNYVDCVESAESSQASRAPRRKLYWK